MYAIRAAMGYTGAGYPFSISVRSVYPGIPEGPPWPCGTAGPNRSRKRRSMNRVPGEEKQALLSQAASACAIVATVMVLTGNEEPALVSQLLACCLRLVALLLDERES
jgi:hypothetical protein